tara:strand:- start:7635 stop:9113 length:1479 start_codon:yes stop_codon:yes gene_type:complete
MKIIDFIKQIGIPEFKSVIGRWGSKIIFLVGILLISLIAMGVAEGSLNYLKKKMNDPFVQFVDVDRTLEPVPGFSEFNIQIAKEYAKNDLNGVKTVFETHAKFERFVNINNQSIEATKEGFILDTKNEFYKSLNERNLFITDNKFHDNQWGIIITERFMNQLGIDKKTPYVNIKKAKIDIDNKIIDESFPVPICGVVEKLRNNKDFIMTKKLYSLLYGNSDKISILKSDSSQGICKWFLPDELTLSDELKNLGLVKSDIYGEQSLPHVEGIMLETENFKIDLSSNGAYRVYDYNVLDLEIENNMGDPDTYTLLFKNPDFVLTFDSWIEKKYGIDLEESRMEAKRNFGFFEKLSKLLSSALIAFSIISIIFFIINLLLSHINKNKRNLGTLKAFGLANKHIVILYSSITLLLVTIAYVSAYILSALLGQFVLDSYIVLNKINSENYLNYVVFENRNFLKTFGQFVLLPTIIIIYNLYKSLHEVTPGDLIYERK